MKEIMGNNGYDNYKATMALYLAPNSLSNRGRFCCAYCELVFTDQWSLEKVKFSFLCKIKREEEFILAFTFC
jgi:hypothetical protein